MSKSNKPEIYFHVGLGKAASTFLQYNVFPKFRDVKYLQTTRHKRYRKIISRGKYDKYLLSREFDHRQFEDLVKDFSSSFPETKTIIIFRRHDNWIASQYKRYIKNGNPWNFYEFIDIENDTGYWKKDEVFYFRKIEILEKYFNHKPLVLFYEDLKNKPEAFINRIADYISAAYNLNNINLTPRHRSYNEKQLKAVFAVSKRINIRKHREFKINIFNYIRRFFINIVRYSTMYIALMLPGSIFRKDPLISPEKLSAIREYYSDDWNTCLEYVKNKT